MKTIVRLGLLTVSTIALSAGVALADFELNILHINDLHSRIEPINKFDSTCSAEEQSKNECFGGIARVKSAVSARRAQLLGQNVLVLDAGDQFQGSLYYSTLKSAPVAEFLNGIGVDALAIGNHEFDDGPLELLKFINRANFPILSGNAVPNSRSVLFNKYRGHTVKTLGGEKVGIVSVLATDTPETSSPGRNVEFRDEIEYLKEAVAELEGEGVNKIILLSHVGYLRDQEIAAAVDGIDVIVGGHSHTLLSNTDEKAAGPYPTLVKNPAGIDVPVVTAYAYSKYLGDLKVVFDDNGVVKSAEGAPKLLDASVTPDAAFVARVAELGAPLEELKKQVVGATDAAIDGDRNSCRAGECSMGNLVADALLDRVKDQGVTIAITNGGGLRASIDAGEVTKGEVLTVLPFQNTLATFEIKGADIVAALENGVSRIEEGAGRFPQVAGLKFSFDRSRPAGSRIVSVETREGDGFVPLDAARTYGVVTNNYVRGGGDGFKPFAENASKIYDFGPNLEDVVADYLANNYNYKPYTDGRIVEVTPAQAAAEAEQPAADAAATAAAVAAPSAQVVEKAAEAAAETTEKAVEATANVAEKAAEAAAATAEQATEAAVTTTEKAVEATASAAENAAEAAGNAAEAAAVTAEQATEAAAATTENAVEATANAAENAAEAAGNAAEAAAATAEQATEAAVTTTEKAVEATANAAENAAGNAAEAAATTAEQATEAAAATTENAVEATANAAENAAEAAGNAAEAAAATAEQATEAAVTTTEKAVEATANAAENAAEAAGNAAEAAAATAEKATEAAATTTEKAVEATANAAENAADTVARHTVAAGDSLWSIAQRHYGDGNAWRRIATANKLKNPNSLEIGDVLELPAH